METLKDSDTNNQSKKILEKPNNYAYINGANLHKGVESLGWNINYHRFRVWLSEKYKVKTAYLFIGLIPKYKELYKYLQESGFTLVFKEVVYDGNNKPNKHSARQKEKAPDADKTA